MNLVGGGCFLAKLLMAFDEPVHKGQHYPAGDSAGIKDTCQGCW
ncbi:MAG: hypothetical protein OXD45_15290 [Rhodobacteraceae bacterium]|nr:hypothetical protein [Paracoccaceae bacterium]